MFAITARLRKGCSTLLPVWMIRFGIRCCIGPRESRIALAPPSRQPPKRRVGLELMLQLKLPEVESRSCGGRDRTASLLRRCRKQVARFLQTISHKRFKVGEFPGRVLLFPPAHGTETFGRALEGCVRSPHRANAHLDDPIVVQVVAQDIAEP